MCPNFAAGFCSFGYSCQLRHDLSEESPPAIAVQFLATDPAKAWIASRKAAQRSFRTAPCPYFHNDGWCPYFLSCAFSHELKTPPVPLSLASFPPLPTRPPPGVAAPVALPAHSSFDRPPSRRGPPPTFLPRGSRGTWRGGRGGSHNRGFVHNRGYAHARGRFAPTRGSYGPSSVHFYGGPASYGGFVGHPERHAVDPRFHQGGHPSFQHDDSEDLRPSPLRLSQDDAKKEWGEMGFE